MGGVVRIGETVHRAVGYWTPAVHSLLSYLEPRLSGIPRVLGFDDDGREVLDFLPGQVVDSDIEMLSEQQIVSVVNWTRDFHLAVTDFSCVGPWRYFPIPSAILIGHNDIAPYNICFDGDSLVGVFDWDMAGPTTPLNELSFIAWNCVPLWRDIGSELSARRLAIIAATYGGIAPQVLLESVPGRIQIMLDGIPKAAAAGDSGMVGLMAGGEPARSQVSLRGLVHRIPEIHQQLIALAGTEASPEPQ